VTSVLTHHQVVPRGIVLHPLYVWQSGIFCNKSTSKSPKKRKAAPGPGVDRLRPVEN
jgi:hypothetical protein